MSFEKASSVNAVGNHYEAHIADGWDILGNANGGYLMALGARAMAEASRPHPFTVTAHFRSHQHSYRDAQDRTQIEYHARERAWAREDNHRIAG
jgi:hypothetical protein